MNAYWKIGLILGWGVIAFLTGWHQKGVDVEADKVAALQAQKTANDEKLKAIEQIATATETALSAERQKSATLNQKWQVERAKKTHTDCKLDGDTIGLLQSTTTGHNLPR